MRDEVHYTGSDAILYGKSLHPRTYGTFPRFIGGYRPSGGRCKGKPCRIELTSCFPTCSYTIVIPRLCLHSSPPRIARVARCLRPLRPRPRPLLYLIYHPSPHLPPRQTSRSLPTLWSHRQRFSSRHRSLLTRKQSRTCRSTRTPKQSHRESDGY